MLFDLRGAGRRTTIKVVYLTLAVLMGGGLVLFGIGGDVSGGLVDAITERGGSAETSSESFRTRAEQAEAKARANPQNAADWAAATRARFQFASAGEFFDQAQGTFTPEGRAELERASASWERYLELDPPQVDDSVASLMVQAYSQAGLNQPAKAARAQEIITEARPRAANFANLAVFAYQAGQTRKGDLARKEALRRAEKDERNQLKAQLDAAKQQALQQQIEGATGSPTTPPGGQGGG